MNLYGKPKLGKSYAALGIAMAVSDPSCGDWLGHKVNRHGPVVYLQVDTPRTEWAGRQERLIEAGYNIDNIYFTDANLVPYPFDINNPDHKNGLKQKLEEIKPVLIVIDTLREIHTGDENASGDMKNVITGLVQCTKDINCGMILVSHSRKDQIFNGRPADDDLMNDARGSTYISGRMDVVAKLTEKSLVMKGRAIGLTKLAVEQGPTGMLTLDTEKAENESHIKHVLEDEHLKTDMDRSRMLAGLEGIEIEAARSRIRSYREKQALTSK